MTAFATPEFSLRQRLRLLTMNKSGVGVLLGCLGFLAFDSHVARDLKEMELHSVAGLVGTNATGAPAFEIERLSTGRNRGRGRP
jgi:hypothetical protein